MGKRRKEVREGWSERPVQGSFLSSSLVGGIMSTDAGGGSVEGKFLISNSGENVITINFDIIIISYFSNE